MTNCYNPHCKLVSLDTIYTHSHKCTYTDMLSIHCKGLLSDKNMIIMMYYNNNIIIVLYFTAAALASDLYMYTAHIVSEGHLIIKSLNHGYS